MSIFLNAANIISLLRIVISCFLLFALPLSVQFFALYLAAGITDMVDGAVARHTNMVSEFGTKLDTAADLIFFAVCFVKLFPLIFLPVWLWLWIAAIGIVKAVLMLINFMRHNLKAEHNVANKAIGFMLFLFPLVMCSCYQIYYAVVISVLATVSALWQLFGTFGHINIFETKYTVYNQE